MDDPYCLLCQEGHQMSEYCVLLHAQCKGCGKMGHFRKDCSQQQQSTVVEEITPNSPETPSEVLSGLRSSLTLDRDTPEVGEAMPGGTAGKMKLTEEQKNQIVDECVEDKVSHSPTILAMKWKCSPRSIRTWIQKAGKQLPRKYKKPISKNESENTCVGQSADDIENRLEHEDNRANENRLEQEDDSGDRGIKRKISDQGPPCPSKAMKLSNESDSISDLSRTGNLSSPSPSHKPDTESESDNNVDIVDSNADSGIIRISLEVTEEGLAEGDTNDNVIYISDDDDDNNLDGKGTSCKESIMPRGCQDSTGPILDDQKKIETSCGIQESLKSPNLAPQIQEPERKSPDLKAGKYTIVSVHMELFRSSRCSSSKLTQLGCVVADLSQSSFFKAIKPRGIENFLDHYKLGGDLLQALHMTREDDGTFLFRSRFEAIKEDNKIVCIEENEALQSCLVFLESFPNCVIVGVDEDTVAILAKKLKYADRDKFKNISGFTYWKRILKYLDVEGYRSIDLEEYYTNLIGIDLPSFNTAKDIASVVLTSVKDVTKKENEGRKSVDANFYKLCKRIECIEHPTKFACGDENVEVYSSFRPAVSATISAEKLEEIVLSSESDSEPEETGRSRAEFGRNICVSGPLREVFEATENVCRRKERRQPRATDESGSCMDTSEVNGYCARVPPRSVQKYTVQSQSALQPQSAVQPTSAILDTWQIGEPTPREGTVVCPIPNCSRVRYSRISKHILEKHPRMVLGSLLCSVCKKSVSASHVHVHMSKCSPSTKRPRKKKAKKPLPMGIQTPASDNSVPPRRSPRLAKFSLTNSIRNELPARLRSAAPLTGLCILDDSIASGQALSALWIVLDSYLMTNYAPFKGGLNNCPQMYHHYQETVQSQGNREVLSEASFVIALTGLAKDHWNLDVGPVAVESGQLYFRGFKKVTIDAIHTML